MHKITTTIKREYLKDIVAKRKRIEYREIKDYWENRLARVETPFLLRLINGMSQSAPEVTVEVRKVVKNKAKGDFELHLGRIVDVKHWDIKRERPRQPDARMRPRPRTTAQVEASRSRGPSRATDCVKTL